MKKKQLLQTMFAFGAAAFFMAGCSNEETTGIVSGNGTDTSVIFRLGLPGGDEVGYTRAGAPVQDDTEWAVKKLKVYDFVAKADGDTLLAGAYNLSLLESTATLTAGAFSPDASGGKYNVKLSLPGAVGEVHVFAFLANDAATTFDNGMKVGTTTIDEFRKSTANKQMTAGSNTSAFSGSDGLGMTGLSKPVTLAVGENTTDAVPMIRMMARVDVKNFVSASRNFELVSVKLKNCAPMGYLFERRSDNTLTSAIWDYATPVPVSLEQNPEFTTNGYKVYGTAGYLDDKLVGEALDNGRTGTWYKKVLYTYGYLASRDGVSTPAPTLVVDYKLNGWPNSIEVPMVKEDAGGTKRFDIIRNHLYTLQIGDTQQQGQPLTFTVTVEDWEYHEINADLNGGTNI